MSGQGLSIHGYRGELASLMSKLQGRCVFVKKQSWIGSRERSRNGSEGTLKYDSKKGLTRICFGDILVTMSIQDTLKKMVNQQGLRKVARKLGIDHASLYRSVNSDLRIGTAQRILNLLGCDLKIVKRKEVKKWNRKKPKLKQ